MNSNVIVKTWKVSRDELSQVAHHISEEILATRTRPFVVWLQGDLGAGKTTITGEILHAMGLPSDVPVLSPTFTYLTEYRTSKGLLGHMDLYRLIDGDEDSVKGFLDGRNFTGLFVEWPERTIGSDLIKPTHLIKMNIDDDDLYRRITFEIKNKQ